MSGSRLLEKHKALAISYAIAFFACTKCCILCCLRTIHYNYKGQAFPSTFLQLISPRRCPRCKCMRKRGNN